MTDHFSRIGNGSQYSTDLVEGGAGNDWLFGQLFDDTLHGQDGDDIVHGGTGFNVATGGAGINDARPGSNDRPADLLLDLLEDYQFDTLSPTTLKLIDDIGRVPDVTNSELQFRLQAGNFIADQEN